MDILTVIREFLHDRLGVAPSTINPETTLAELQVDSLMLVELIFECEEKFNVTFDRDIPTPNTIGDMMAIVEGFIATAQARSSTSVSTPTKIQG